MAQRVKLAQATTASCSTLQAPSPCSLEHHPENSSDLLPLAKPLTEQPISVSPLSSNLRGFSALYTLNFKYVSPKLFGIIFS